MDKKLYKGGFIIYVRGEWEKMRDGGLVTFVLLGRGDVTSSSKRGGVSNFPSPLTCTRLHFFDHREHHDRYGDHEPGGGGVSNFCR